MGGMKATRNRPWFLLIGTVVGAILGGVFAPEYSYACVAEQVRGTVFVGLFVGLVLDAFTKWAFPAR